MTLLITGPWRIQVIKQGGLCLLGMCHLVPQLAQPPSFSSAERDRGSCLCHQPTQTHPGSRAGKGGWGSIHSSDLELGSTLTPGKAETSPSFTATLALCYY